MCYACARAPLITAADHLVMLSSLIFYLIMCLQFYFALFLDYTLMQREPKYDLCYAAPEYISFTDHYFGSDPSAAICIYLYA